MPMIAPPGSQVLEASTSLDVEGGEPAPDVDPLATLMLGVQARDASALEALYDATCGRLLALAVAILRSREDAEEVVCDCLAQVWHGAARYDAGRGTVLGWLMLLCRSRALDRLRARRRHVGVEIEAADAVADARPAPDELLTLLEEGSRVRQALARLPGSARADHARHSWAA